ncbi:hypothetical protein MLD38_040083 [Melastoma candidum]|uniref:Uncharacterized protein n=1 Tax=Melastoma candidum TaxID=119954 RepID=A0ACB9L5C6_9MYRT|nr:hypothetical protein MLD38_040083 [Melastoma candidum]
MKETMDDIDLWILGRGRGMNPTLLMRLKFWRDNYESGLAGDWVSSPDFGGVGSVLVVQQQVMREQGMAAKGCLDGLTQRVM